MSDSFSWYNSRLNVGAYLLCPFRSTIGDGELNCRIRNENGWTLSAKAPTFNLEFYFDTYIVWSDPEFN